MNLIFLPTSSNLYINFIIQVFAFLKINFLPTNQIKSFMFYVHHHCIYVSILPCSTILFAIFAFMCRKNVLIALSTLEIQWASSFDRSSPNSLSISTTNSTESRESIPRSENLLDRVIIWELFFICFVITCMTLASTSSSKET